MVVVAVPLSDVFPTAAASSTMSAGRGTWVWRPSRLNFWPGDGDAGDNVALMVTSLNTRSPIGVFAQKSSKPELSARADPVKAACAPTTMRDPATRETAPA